MVAFMCGRVVQTMKHVSFVETERTVAIRSASHGSVRHHDRARLHAAPNRTSMEASMRQTPCVESYSTTRARPNPLPLGGCPETARKQSGSHRSRCSRSRRAISVLRHSSSSSVYTWTTHVKADQVTGGGRAPRRDGGAHRCRLMLALSDARTARTAGELIRLVRVALRVLETTGHTDDSGAPARGSGNHGSPGGYRVLTGTACLIAVPAAPDLSERRRGRRRLDNGRTLFATARYAGCAPPKTLGRHG